MRKERQPDIFMPWFIMDYQKDTMHLTLEEDCCYRRMLDMHWLSKAQGLPDDDARIASIIRVPLETWQRVKPALLPFFEVGGGFWRQQRNYSLYLRQLGLLQTASERGRKAAQKRWGNRASNAQALPKECYSNPNTVQRECTQRLHGIPGSVEEVVAFGKTCTPPVSEERCREFWAHYEGQARRNPNGDLFWVTSADTVVTNWKVKLPQFGKKNENHRTPGKPGAGQRPDRNLGTANEGNAGKYRHLGKVAPPGNL